VKQVTIYTDGACSGNPGPGGWGALLQYGEVEKELRGGERATTNNRMELLAAIMALESLKEPCEVLLYTDSKYVMQGITEWLAGWKKRAGKPPVKSRSKITIYGCGLTPPRRGIIFSGNG